jgi:predicted esterase/anti-sigma factor RsiW
MSERLIDRWVSGNASAEERAELVELLEHDPALIERLFHAAERECSLQELFGGLSPVSLAPPAPSPRPAARARRAPPATWWLPFSTGLAAALLVAVLFSQASAPRTVEPLAAVTTRVVAAPAPAPATVKAEPAPAPLSPVEDDDLLVLDGPPAAPYLASANSTTPAPAPVTTVATGAPATAPPLMAARTPAKNHPERIERIDGSLQDAEGNLVMRYSLRVPHVLPLRPELGLLLCFHGAGGDEQWLADPLLSALRSRGQATGMVVAALKSKGPNWAAADESNVIAFIDWARRTYPVNPRRIVIQGVSNGGWMVSHFGSRHPELVAGVVTVCGGNGFEAPAKRPGNAAETGFEYYVVHGTADEEVNVKSARGITDMLRANGYRYVYREYPGVGHEVFNDGVTRSDFAGWLSRLRHKTMPLAEDERRAMAAFAKRDEAERLILTEEGANTLVRIGGLPAEKVLVRALRSRTATVRAAAARLLARTSNLPGATTLLAALLEDKDLGVRQAALDSLASAADWNDQEALTAVCRFAGAKAPGGERLRALGLLTGALAFRCTPGHDNLLIHELLVHLLDDDEPALRAAAITALPRVEPERFGYDPEAGTAGRREAAARWRRWYLDLLATTEDKPDARR